MANNNGLIVEIEKNANEIIRIALTEYRGHDLLDIRVYYRDDHDEWQPTREGISLRVDLIDELRTEIEKAAKIIQMRIVAARLAACRVFRWHCRSVVETRVRHCSCPTTTDRLRTQ